MIFGQYGLVHIEARVRIKCIGHVTGMCYEFDKGTRRWVDRRDWERMQLYQSQEGEQALRRV